MASLKRQRKAARRAAVQARMTSEETPAPRPPTNSMEALRARLRAQPPCAHCGFVHQGNSEEFMMDLDPVAVVMLDRDVATNAIVAGLCGPRFRKSNSRQLACYGFAGHPGSFVVFQWDAVLPQWEQVIPKPPPVPFAKTSHELQRAARRDLVQLLARRSVIVRR